MTQVTFVRPTDFTFAAMIEILGFIGAILMGVTLGLIGGGGSILTVPILIYAFGMDAVLATSYSLVIVGVSAFAGGINYFKKHCVDFKVALWFGSSSLLSVYLTRRFIMPSLPETLFETGSVVISKDLLVLVSFAALMLLASIKMIFGKSPEPAKGEINSLGLLLQGLLVGLVTGFVGAGGGFIIVPSLVYLAKLDMKRAIGTSLLIISVNSLLGFFGDLQSESVEIDFGFLGLFIGLALIGIFVGTYLSKVISGAKLKPLFGYFVLLVGALILTQQIMSI